MQIGGYDIFWLAHHLYIPIFVLLWIHGPRFFMYLSSYFNNVTVSNLYLKVELLSYYTIHHRKIHSKIPKPRED